MQDTTKAVLDTVAVTLQKLTATIRQETTDVLALNDHVELIRHFDSCRKALDKIKESREALQQLADHLSSTDIPDVMKAHSVKTITIEGVGRATVSYRWSASMLDKEQGIKWLKENDHGGIVQETVNAQTLAAFAKELQIDKGIDLPVEFFKVGTLPYTSITKV